MFGNTLSWIVMLGRHCDAWDFKCCTYVWDLYVRNIDVWH